MIKTSGYRVSPTEIEEVAYDTGLVRDAVAVGVPDETARPARGPRRHGLAAPGPSIPRPCSQAFRQALPLYMVPAEIQ